MKKTIWKFTFAIDDVFHIEMPKGAEILTVQNQSAVGTIWAIVNPEAPKEIRTFCIQGTGNPFELIDYKYIGTFQQMGGALVWHLFESNI